MKSLNGYKIVETVYEGKNTQVYRAMRDEDNTPVIIKIPRSDYPGSRELALFRKEYEIGITLEDEGVGKPLALEKYNNGLALILEDFGGVSLQSVLRSKKVSLQAFLKIAIRLTRSIEYIHRNDIIHMDIKPNNIIINLQSGRVCISDFGISTMLSRENPSIVSPGKLEGTLAYISPEQTGRMNRAIDYRTDFYSLGATFYEMLSGNTPFQSDDPMEMVHFHIAVEPVPLHQVRDDIPEALSSIVTKLLAKNAEDRYQSAYGLRMDLEECLRQLKATNNLAPFPLGKNDHSEKFQVPQKLYGREGEIEILMKAFKRASKGASSLMLVKGFSGIGKSALVSEVHKPIVEHRGYFISGKFDQFKKDIPYSSLLQAFQELVRQILTESSDQIENWRENLVNALGPNGQVIVDVIPEIELIIGKQAQVPELGPTEAQNRFNVTFKRFLSTFAHRNHPLVLFLDDLQWSDNATLKLIQMIVSDPEIRYLFIICAYRDNEVDESHPLMGMVNDLKKLGHEPDTIAIPPISLKDVIRMITDTLGCEEAKADPLAKLVHSKTSGNPFFVSEFLKTLYQEKLLNVQPGTMEWQWDLLKIQQMGITDNVVELMADKIQKLGGTTQAILRLAACIGNSFDLNTLCIVNEKSAKQSQLELQPALKEGMVLPLGDDYKFGVEDSNIQYKFLHDRVQQAAYGLIPESERGKIHLAIGRHILAKTPEPNIEERIFDIANHFNFGRSLIQDETERITICRVNMAGGKKAKSATAYGPAVRYLRAAIELLPRDPWQTQYELTYNIYTELADSEGLNSNYKESHQIVDLALKNTRTTLEKTRLYEIKIRNYNGQSELVNAIETAREILKLLGVSLPKKANFVLDVGPALLKTKIMIFRRGDNYPLTAPDMTDPAKIAAMRILMLISSSLYQQSFNGFAVLVMKMAYLTYKFGNATPSPYSIGLYGLAHTGVLEFFRDGLKYGKLSLKLLEKMNAREVKAKTIMLYNTFIQHWINPLTDTFEPFKEGAQAGAENGDPEFGPYCNYFHGMNKLFSTGTLDVLEQDFLKWLRFSESNPQQQALIFGSTWTQCVLNLRGKAEDKLVLKGEKYNIDEILPFVYETEYRPGFGWAHFITGWLNFMFRNHEKAAEEFDKAFKAEQYLMAMSQVPVMYMFQALNYLAMFPKATPSQKRRYMRIVNRRLRKLKKWARYAPINQQRKVYLVEAEKSRVRGEIDRAMNFYDKAIQGSRETEFLMEESLSNELAAQFYMELGKEKIARTYLTDARYSYSRWGCPIKVEDLDQRFPDIMRKILAAEGASETAGIETTGVTTTHSSTGRTASSLDINTVMKASQALSSEIFLDQLLGKLMKIALENAGAQRGSLMLEKDHELLIEAQAEADGTMTVMQSIPIEEGKNIGSQIVHYVVRTVDNVVLGDATKEGRFINTPYIIENKPKSILCMPIINQGKLFGILYLENNLTTNAFTPDRVDVLKILMSQAAISLENSRLVAEETERQKLQKEMEMAKEVQMSILPEFPPDDAYSITAHMVPAEQVGGDYYDFYRVNGHRWIAIGDVTGHGLNSGLLMLMAQTGFSTYLNTTSHPDTVELFTSLNKTLHNNMATRTKQGLYMTFTALRADSEGNFEHVGKHEDILIYRKNTGKVEIVKSDGFWMGVVPDVSAMIHKANFKLAPGDFITLFTDGVIECRNKAGEQFDTSRLVSVIESKASEGIETIKEAIIKSCMDFMHHMDDDITVFLMQKK